MANILKINLISKYEFKRVFLKSIILNTALPFFIRYKASRLISLFGRYTSLSYLRLGCTKTGRTRSVLTFFKLSRISFRNLYSYGYLNGLRKASR